jgi:hypothetical protein
MMGPVSVRVVLPDTAKAPLAFGSSTQMALMTDTDTVA